MSKHNLLIKKIQKQILSINYLIERSFNNLKYFKSNYKKILLDKDNRVILGVVIVVILTLFYFLIPTIYNKTRMTICISMLAFSISLTNFQPSIYSPAFAQFSNK